MPFVPSDFEFEKLKIVTRDTRKIRYAMQYFYVYILKCADGTYYIGQTDNIEYRISQHNSGEYICYTSTRLPVKVMFVHKFATRDEAIDAERKLKKWSHKKKEALINGDTILLSLLAKKKF